MTILFKKITFSVFRFLATSFENNDENLAVYFLEILVKGDHNWGLVELGYRYSIGKGVSKDKGKALLLFKKAYAQKLRYSGLAAANIAQVYKESDIETYVHWLKIGAELNDRACQYNYGISLVEGWVSKANKAEGMLWIRKAYSLGDSFAKAYLENPPSN